jgi:hypothetical protein
METYHTRVSSRNKLRKNLPLQFALAELAAVGVKPNLLEGKYLKVRSAHTGRAHTTVAHSTSDWRASRNAVAFVRRQLDGRRP